MLSDSILSLSPVWDHNPSEIPRCCERNRNRGACLRAGSQEKETVPQVEEGSGGGACGCMTSPQRPDSGSGTPAPAVVCAQATHRPADFQTPYGLGQRAPRQQPVGHKPGKLLECSALCKGPGILSHLGQRVGTPGNRDWLKFLLTNKTGS